MKRMVTYWVMLVLSFAFIPQVYSQLVVGPFKNADVIVTSEFLSGNIRTRNHQYTGSSIALAIFASNLEYLPISRGIILCTGNAGHAASPNMSGNSGLFLGLPGDKQLSSIANNITFDAAILEFDFLPPSDSICFNFFFASDEYPEFVGKGVNDVFAFFLTDLTTKQTKNLAILPDGETPVTVDNINQQKNSQFFIENKLWVFGNYDFFASNPCAAALSENLEYDGITSQLVAASKLVPYRWYHIRIAIADAGDPQYDSAVFLESKSFRSPGKIPENSFELDLQTRIAEYPELKLEKQKDKIIVTSNIEFMPDSFNISPEYQSYLFHIVTILKKYTYKNLKISGHTDNTGNKSHNLELSEKRANSIADFLVEKKIDKSRLKTIGYGETKPLLPNTSDENKTRNRRVEFEFLDAL